MNKPESEMVLVPREPTHEMMVAVDDAYGDGGDFADMWEAAIAAAPTRPTAADFEAWLRTVCFQKPTPEAYDLAKCAWRDSRLAAHPSNQVLQEPVAWDYRWFNSDAAHGRVGWSPWERVAPVTLETMHSAVERVRRHIAWLATGNQKGELRALYASPQAVPSEQPIAEQPKSLESHLTSASGGDASKTALPEACDIEAIIACLGDDAAQLCDENLEDERAANMVEAAALLRKLADENAAVARLLLDQDREGAKAWARGLYISMDGEGGLTASAREARVEPVVGPLSSARSNLPSMPPPAASLPVSAPAGQEDARDAKRYRALRQQGGPGAKLFVRGAWSGYLGDYRHLIGEELDAAIDAMSATTKEN